MSATLNWLQQSTGGACQSSEMAAVLNSLSFVFKNLFLPKSVWVFLCSRVNDTISKCLEPASVNKPEDMWYGPIPNITLEEIGTQLKKMKTGMWSRMNYVLVEGMPPPSSQRKSEVFPLYEGKALCWCANVTFRTPKWFTIQVYVKKFLNLMLRLP